MYNYDQIEAREVLVENVKKIVVHLVATFGVMALMMGINGVSLWEGLLDAQMWFLAMLLYPLVRFAMLFKGSIVLMFAAFIGAFATVGTFALRGNGVLVTIGLVGFTVCCFGYYIYNIVVCAKILKA